MLTRILRHSPQVSNFFDIITSQGPSLFSAPQRQHLIEVMDALLVCPEQKTLAALQRQCVATTEVSNWASVQS